MTNTRDFGRLRLGGQHISGKYCGTPGDVLASMGMLQAQDYLGALWAVGLRMRTACEAEIERALASRDIVRTWPARGTLHFVAAADVRWMLALLAPRAIQSAAGRMRALGLDEAQFARGAALLSRALQGGGQLPRDATYQILQEGGVSTAGQRGIHILWRLAQQGLICFGARSGKQHTFTLLAEWLPPVTTAVPMTRAEALTELARRFFTSRGPAILQDFVWWSGLSSADAGKGLALARPHLASVAVDGRTYWQAAAAPRASASAHAAYLLPAFDEYLVAYKDRSAVLDPAFVKKTNAGGGMLNPVIVIDGQVAGTWKRTLKKGTVVVTPSWFAPPRSAQKDALNAAAQRYGAFLGLAPVILA